MKKTLRIFAWILIITMGIVGLGMGTLALLSRSPTAGKWLARRISQVSGITLRSEGLALSFLPFRVSVTSFDYQNKSRTLSLSLHGCHAMLEPLSLLKQSLTFKTAGCDGIKVTRASGPKNGEAMAFDTWFKVLHHLQIKSGRVGSFDYRFQRKDGPMDVRSTQIQFSLKSLNSLGDKRLSIVVPDTIITAGSGKESETLARWKLEGDISSFFPLLTVSPYPESRISLAVSDLAIRGVHYPAFPLTFSLSKQGVIHGKIERSKSELFSALEWSCPLAIASGRGEGIKGESCKVRIEQLAWAEIGKEWIAARPSRMLERLATAYPTLSFTLDHAFSGQTLEGEGKLRLSFEGLELTPPTHIDSAYRWNGKGLALDRTSLSNAPEEIARVKGGLARDQAGTWKWDLSFDADHFHMDPWLSILTNQPIRGLADFHGKLWGKLKQPEVEAIFSVIDVDYVLFHVKRLNGKIDINPKALTLIATPVAPNRAEIDPREGKLSLQVFDLYERDKRLLDLDAVVSSIPWSLVFGQEIPDAMVTGQFSMRAHVGHVGKVPTDAEGGGAFTGKNIRVAGVLDIDAIDARLALERGAPIGLVIVPTKFTTAGEDMILGDAHKIRLSSRNGERTLEGTPLPGTRLALHWPLENPKEVRGSLSFSQASLAPFLGTSPLSALNPLLSGEGEIKVPLGNPKQTAFRFKGSGLVLESDSGPVKNSGPFTFSVEGGVAKLDGLTLTGQDNRFSLGLQKPLFAPTPLEVSVNGTLGVSLINTLYPELGLGKGGITVDLKAIPTTKTVTGTVALKDVHVSLASYPDIAMRSGSLVFEGKRVSLRDITGNVDKGSFSLRGTSDWGQASGLVSDIDIGMQNLPFTWQNSFYATLDGKIHWNGLRWEGDIDIVEGHYYRPFRLLNMFLEPTPTRGETGPFDLAAIQGNGLDLQIRDLGSLYVENNVAELVLSADLSVRGTVGTPVLDGALEVQSGEVNFMGFSFDDTSGEIIWNNQTANNPSVDIKGSREIADYEIHALLSGALTNLRLSFESDPPLSPNEVIQVLLSGESPETAQSFNRNFLSTQFAASQLLNLLQGPLSDISRLDTVKLASERSETDPTRSFTRIYFGKQLTPRLNLNYSTSIGAENEFQGFEAEYLISDHFLIKAGKRDETRYGFDLTVRFEAN